MALGYDEAIDPSVFVRMPLVDQPDISLLVWTTTPWTLPGNVAVAAHPDVDYVIVERDNNGGKEKLILAKSLVEKVFGDEEVKVVDTFKGRKLNGMKYHPLYTSCRLINLPLCGAGGFCHHRRWYGPRPYGARIWPGGHGDGPSSIICRY